MKSINGLEISNQLGLIHQGTGFLLFGPVAVIGSHLDIEFGGIADYKPSRIFLRFVWLDLPASFGIYFQGYQVRNAIGNHSFHVDFYLKSGEDLRKLNDRPLELFAEDADRFLEPEKIFDFDIDPKWIYSDNCSIRMVFVGDEFAFGHGLYGEALLKAILCAASGDHIELINPPFAPKVKKVSLSFS